MPQSPRAPASSQQQQRKSQNTGSTNNSSSLTANGRGNAYASASSDVEASFPPPPPIPQPTSYSRPASRTSMAETFRTATPHSFDQRRPSITPNLSQQQQRAASPLIFDDQHQNQIRTASPSLALNYVPGKFSTRVFQPDRSHSPASGGIFASRSTSKLRPIPNSGSSSHLSPPYALALGPSSRSNSGNNTDVDEEEEEQEEDEQERLGAVTPFTTAVRQAAASNPAQAPRLRHSIKRGAGRSAWGPDGAGNRALGAGDYEDDDGVDLSRTASQRLGLRRRNSANRKGAVGGSTSSHRSRRIVEAPGEADRRRTSMLHSNLGHFEEIEDEVEDNSDLDSEIDEHGLRPPQVNGGNAGQGASKSNSNKKKRTRSMRRDPNDPPLPSSSAHEGGGGGWTSGRMGYLLGFHDGDDDRTQLGHGRPSEYGHGGDETVGLRKENRPRSDLNSRTDSTGRTAPRRRRRARWNPFKWAMVVANLVLTVYAMAALFGTLLTWANIFDNAATVRVGNRTELILGTIAAGLCFASAVIGWCGILLNNRAFLSIYITILWIAFIFIMAPGYITFKRRTFNLEGKINQQWSRRLSVSDRLAIQDELNCCGYYSPFALASASGRCYARSMLPGCKGKYLRFQRTALEYFYICAFGIVGPHLLIITVALLCSNHVTYRFGKGLTPEEYRLDEVTTELIKDQLLKTQRGQNQPQRGLSSGASEKVGQGSQFRDGDTLRPPAFQYREDSYAASTSKSGKGTDEAGSSTAAHHEQGNGAYIDTLAADDHSRASGSGSGSGSAGGSGRRYAAAEGRGEEHELREMNVRGASDTTYDTAGAPSEDDGPVFYAQ